MLLTYFTAIASMIVIACLWLAVQRLWLRHFPSAGDDALANRSGCQGCNCGPSGCQREQQTQNRTTTEVP